MVDINGIYITVKYDNNALNATGVSKGDLLAPDAFLISELSKDEISIMIFGESTISGDGSVATLTFNKIGADISSDMITITNARIVDSSNQVTELIGEERAYDNITARETKDKEKDNIFPQPITEVTATPKPKYTIVITPNTTKISEKGTIKPKYTIVMIQNNTSISEKETIVPSPSETETKSEVNETNQATRKTPAFEAIFAISIFLIISIWFLIKRK